ncbi:MAG: hypothetical protein GTN49_05045 [candidate division Zixibacteria bacterium]|nr:hypothetical protein [candidate division Zixibacteria bacterium]
MRRLVYWVMAVVTAGAAGAAPVNYKLTASSTYEVDDASAEAAHAFGIPALSLTETTATFSLEPLGDGVYRLTFLTAGQRTLAGDVVIGGVENVGDFLPGRWLEFAPWTMREGGIKRAPAFVKDSEELSYNLLALMLFAPGGPLADLWRDGARAAVARSCGFNLVLLEVAEGRPLPAFEGGESGQVAFAVAFEQQLTQDTKLTTMTGHASFEGAGAAVPASDGLPAYARLDLSGKRDRSFVITGEQRDLSDYVSISIRLVREGYELPPEWAAGEEAGGQ